MIAIYRYLANTFGMFWGGRVIFWILDLDSDHTASDKMAVVGGNKFGHVQPPPPEFSQVNPALVPTQAGQRGAIANQDCSSSIMATAWEVEKRWFQKGWHRTGMIRYGVIKFVASEPTPPLMYPHIRFNKVLLRETSHDKLHIFGEHQNELTHRTQYILDLNISSFEF